MFGSVTVSSSQLGPLSGPLCPTSTPRRRGQYPCRIVCDVGEHTVLDGDPFVEAARICPCIPTPNLVADWPGFRHDGFNSGAIAGGTPIEETPAVIWHQPVTGIEGSSRHPVVADDLVIFPDWGPLTPAKRR